MAPVIGDARYGLRLLWRSPGVTAVAAVLLLASATVACLIPARRAASVDPMVALRQD